MILFAGDSFSAWDDDESWTHHFAFHIGKKYKNVSLKGSSLWYAFDCIEKESDKIFNGYYDYLVITCTNYRRIPYCSNPIMSYYAGKVEEEPLDTEEKKQNAAHLNYYDRFYSEKMNKFLYERVLEFIITKYSNHVKIIFLPVFDESLFFLKKTNNWINNFYYLNFQLWDIAVKDDSFVKNHFSLKTNKFFGKVLADKVHNSSFGPINLTLKEFKAQLSLQEG
jgi:hypothetical protein